MKHVLVVVSLMIAFVASAQDVNILLKEAENLERAVKEEAALDKYKQVLAIDQNNIKALIRSSELSSSVGGRQTDKKVKKRFFEEARAYADKALAIDANNADANYVRAVAAGKLTDTETETKLVISHVRDIRVYADKAVAIDPNHARANYVLGKWNFEMVALNWAKRAAVKVMFGGLPEAKIEDAFKYMEKCRSLDKYFVVNYLDLAKAYKYDDKPAKAIEVLNLLVKLPTRTADDAALKAEGKQLLQQLL